MSEIRVFLTKPDEIYFPGDDVQGTVVLNVAASRLWKVKNVIVKVVGKSKVSWREDGGFAERKHVIRSYAKEVYYRHEHFLLSSDLPIALSQGIHEYKFKVKLPTNLPGSLDDKYGQICHYVKVKIEGDTKVDKFSHFFTVVNQLDLNDKPDLKNPQCVADHRTLGCLCCKTGPINSTLKVYKTGFAPGEIFFPEIYVDNDSGKRLAKAKITLLKQVTFRTPRSIKLDNSAIFTANVLNASNGEVSRSPEIKVPPTPPSQTEGCGLIDVSYKLKLVLSPDGLHKDIYLEIPITIGTIPLINTFRVDTIRQENLWNRISSGAQGSNYPYNNPVNQNFYGQMEPEDEAEYPQYHPAYDKVRNWHRDLAPPVYQHQVFSGSSHPRVPVWAIAQIL